MADKKLYKSWQCMKQRCLNIKSPDYHRYGARGISISDNWLKYKGFKYDMANDYKPNKTLERIDNNGNYCKDNCRWATKKEQANNRRTNRVFTINGIKKTFAQWIEYTGVKSSTARQRYYIYGWGIERALGY